MIDFKKFKEVADEVGAYLMVDMAHIAGLVAAGLHPSPVPYADVVTTTTHKTLRGPRGGLILANEEAAKKFNFNKAVFPGIQGGPLMHVIAAKAVCFKEALSEEFKAYQKQIIDNAQALCKGLMDRGVKIVSGGTDNHSMLVDLREKYPDLTGKVAEKALVSYGGVESSKMEQNLSWISLFIAIAPSLGFLGTVIGMIQAFDAIMVAGDMSPAVVAGGMKVALITTVGGLIVAVILQIFYNYILSQVESLSIEMEDASISLMDILVKYQGK